MENATHIIATLILTSCLKKYNPVLLAILLTLILGYISYNEQSKLPIYVLFVFGIIIYIINITTANICTEENNNIWKIPFWGILTYYIFYIKDNWIT